MLNRKNKTQAYTGITEHFCSNLHTDISLSVLPCAATAIVHPIGNNANRMTQSVLGNGVSKNYVYHIASQLSSITFKKGTTTIGDLTYAYDNGGQIIAQNGSLARTSLPPATTANAIYDANNRLTSWNGQAITYDAQGNMLSTGSKTFTWDTRNRLTSIAGGTTAIFSYDTLGRRITKSVPLTANTATQLTYDGANPVVEKQGATVTGTNLTGLGMDSYLTRKDGTTETYPLTDHLGSVIALTDATGAIITSYTYEPYGATTQTGAASVNPHQYTGRENDGTGLYFYRARYYDPQLMRFISEDPIGLAGGVNSYSYVLGSPLNYTDAEGLYVGVAVGIGIRVIGGRAAAGAIGAAASRYGLAGSIAACALAGVCTFNKTPNEGEPGSVHVNPGSGQERGYGSDGKPEWDIDWDHDHGGSGSPHGHNWERDPNGGNPERQPPVPISPWPRDRKKPCD